MQEEENLSQDPTLEDITRKVMDGNRDALERLVQALQGDIFGLALRMCGNREDAEDATQEILVRIITRLSQFDFRSRLKTWAYRVAVNYILDLKKSAAEQRHLSFEQLGENLTPAAGTEAADDTDRSLLIEEIKIGCTLGMLQCLDRSHRLAYVLGEIMELPGPEAAEALEIAPDLFRKRLQFARAAIVKFTKTYCGLVSDTAPCSCHRQAVAALRAGRMNTPAYTLASSESSFQQIRAIVQQAEEAQWAIEVHRTSRPRGSSIDFARRLIEILEARKDRPGDTCID